MQNNLTIDGFFITTWKSQFGEPPFTAVNMTVAADLLEGYNLTDEEKTNQAALMAGYCRLLDENNLVGFGETEFESIQDLFSHAVKVDAPSPESE